MNYEEMENYVYQLEEENTRLKQSNKSLRTNNRGLLNGLNKVSRELSRYKKKYGTLNERCLLFIGGDEMIKVGDTVKVIAATEDTSYCDGRKKEYIPIGTICTVTNSYIDGSGVMVCAIDTGDGYAYWYKESELEKGHMEWIKDKDMSRIIDGVTTCCEYDFGVDFSEARYCPICGRKLMKDE